MGRVTMSPATYGTYLYLNNGGGAFTLLENTPFTGHGFGKITVADVNNDGNKDILITGSGEGSNTAVAKLYLNNAILSVQEVEKQNIRLYPNPVHDVVNIESLSEFNVTSFQIYTANGILVKQAKSELNLSALDVSFLNSGIYILTLTGKDTSVTNYKIIKL